MQVWCCWQVKLCGPHLSALEVRLITTMRYTNRRLPYLYLTVPHFSGRKGEEFAVTAVNRGDLWRLNYNKTVFGPHWESSPRPQSDGGGDTSSPFSSRSPSELMLCHYRPIIMFSIAYVVLLFRFDFFNPRYYNAPGPPAPIGLLIGLGAGGPRA